MICCECNAKITKDEFWEELPGKKFIHVDCQDALLDIPVLSEGGQKTQDASSAKKEWWA